MAKKIPSIRALFEDVHNISSEKIAQSEPLKKLLKETVPSCIQHAHSSNKQYATLFEINSTNHYIEIPRKDWTPALETCIMWYLESEEYEKCTKIKQMIEDIQKKTTKKITVKSKTDE